MPGVKTPNVAGEPSVSDSVAGTVPLTPPLTGTSRRTTTSIVGCRSSPPRTKDQLPPGVARDRQPLEDPRYSFYGIREPVPDGTGAVDLVSWAADAETSGPLGREQLAELAGFRRPAPQWLTFTESPATAPGLAPRSHLGLGAPA